MPAVRNDCRAFTLVELLAVIGIISVLIAILLPALSKARSQAREVQCAALLRSWGQAFNTYAALFHGKFPHSGDRSCNPIGFQEIDCPLFPQNNCGWTDMLPPLMGRKPWSSFPFFARPTGDIWQCPLAVIGSDAIYGFQPSKVGYRSFVMNTYLDYDKLVVPSGYKRYPSFLNVGDGRQQSVTLLLFESTLVPAAVRGQMGTGAAACTAGEYCQDGPGTFSDRHPHLRGRLGGHLMMLDGHVEWTDHLWEAALPPSGMPPANDRRWWPY